MTPASRNSEHDGELARVKAHAKRRCPQCQSNRWRWMGAVPCTPEELCRHLLAHYRCRNCGAEFLVEEAKPARIVRSADRCVHCRSRNLELCSRTDADVVLWRCRRCNAYLLIQPGAEEL
jgi:hypothetical protein